MKSIRVWDLPLRLFHWALVVLVVCAVITVKIGGDMMAWHFRCGYAILSLLLFRFVWGFCGPLYARFSSFMPWPGEVFAQLRGLRSSDVLRLVGHNPLGSLSVVMLLLVLLVQACSGLFANDDIAWDGPLVRFITRETSESFTWFHTEVSLLLVYFFTGLHVAAIFFYLLSKKKNLIQPMISGDVATELEAPATDDSAAMRWRAVLVFIVCAALVSVLAFL